MILFSIITGSLSGFVSIAPFILLAIGVLLMLFAATVGKKAVILDREKGLITIPGWFYEKSHTQAFNKAKFLWIGTGGASGALGQQLVMAYPNSTRAFWLNTHVGEFDKSWSFLVWYMDRNRPLPPGDAFDPYRQEDFERRKSEGFPPPLYKSTFATPEATQDQNIERRKYWKDEAYFGESSSRWY